MRHLVRAFVFLASLTSSIAWAEGYIVRVESRGFADVPANLPPPPDVLLHSVETLASFDRQLYAKSVLGNQTLIFSGNLKKAEDGRFTFDPVKFVHEIDRGITIRLETGETKKRPERREAETTVTIELGKPIQIAQSTYRYLVVIERFQSGRSKD